MRLPRALAATGLLLAGWACEFTNVTEARDQLQRGPDRVVSYTVPIARDTLTVADILSDFLGVSTTTVADSLVAIAGEPETLKVAVTGAGTFSGILDPSILSYDTVAYREFTAAGLNLGEFEDAIRDVTLNAALAALVVTNTANAPITLTDFTFGVVRMDPMTNQPRRVGGQLDYEKDGTNQPILVPLADAGTNTYAIGRSATRTDTLDAAALVDRLVDLLLNGIRAAVVGAGTVSIGDNTFGSIAANDELRLELTPVVGLDLTLPPTGVAFDSSVVEEGLGIDTALADDVTGRIEEAGVSLVAANGTPFGLQVVAAVIRGSVTGDVFALPGAVRIDTLQVDPGVVDGTGRVTAATLDTATAALTGSEARELLEEEFTATVRVRLLPTATGRGALRAGDRVIVKVGATLRIRMGGDQ